MTDYTDDELQELVSQLPIERVVKITSNMSKIEAQNAYLSCFMDRDNTRVLNAEKIAIVSEKRANARVRLRESTNEEERAEIMKEIEALTNELEG